MPREIFISRVRSAGDLAGVFEYEGETGYFYLYRTNAIEGRKIIAAIRIVSGGIEGTDDNISVRWDRSETKVGLFIETVMWAVFDSQSGRKFGGNYRSSGKPEIPADLIFETAQ